MSFLENLFDPSGVISGDFSSNSMLDPAGSWLDNLGATPDFYSDTRNSIDTTLDDIEQFEKYQLDQWGKKLQNNPFQLVTGVDPASTKAWNGILDRNDTPLVNVYGGPTEETFTGADKAGINTGPSSATHSIAQAIASSYGGQGLGQLFGAAGQGLGIGSTTGQLVGREVVGAGNNWLNGESPLKGAVNGAVSGTGSLFNVGGSVGIENPGYQLGVNNLFNGLVSSRLNGGKMDNGNFFGALQNFMNGFSNENHMPNVGTMGGSSLEDQGLNTSLWDTPQSNSEQLNDASIRNIMDYSSVYGPSRMANTPTNSQNKPGMLDQLGTLASLYSLYQNGRSLSNQSRSLSGLYSANSPFAQQLEQRLARKDAASGRRSQYGPRNVELQAKLAEMAGNIAPNRLALQQAQIGNSLQMLRALGAANQTGVLDPLKGWLGSLFTSSGG